MLQTFALSIGAIYALIPLVIIIVLIAAAAGLTRGGDIFAILGIDALIGVGSAIGRGGSGKGITSGPQIGGKNASGSRRTMVGVGKGLSKAHKGAMGALAKSADLKSATNEAMAGKIRALAQQASAKNLTGAALSIEERAALIAMGAAGSVAIPPKGTGVVKLSVPGAVTPSKPAGPRFDKSKNVFTSKTQLGGKPLFSTHTTFPMSAITWRARAGKWQADRKSSKLEESHKQNIENHNKNVIEVFRQHAGEAAHGRLMAEARFETRTQNSKDIRMSFAAFRANPRALAAIGIDSASPHSVRYEDWTAYKNAIGTKTSSAPPPMPGATQPWMQRGAGRRHIAALGGQMAKRLKEGK